MVDDNNIASTFNESEFISDVVTCENKKIEKDVKIILTNIKEKRQDGIYAGSNSKFVAGYDSDMFLDDEGIVVFVIWVLFYINQIDTNNNSLVVLYYNIFISHLKRKLYCGYYNI